MLNNIFERRDDARRRRQLRRPGFRIAIEPSCLHAGLGRADYIEMRIVADVKNLRSLDSGFREQLREYADVRLGGTGGYRRDVAFEPVRDPAAFKIRIAIAQRKQPVARTQALQRARDFIVELHAIARRIENFERLIGVAPGMTGRREHFRQGAMAQKSHVVAAFGKLYRDTRPHRAQRLAIVSMHQQRMMFLEPREHGGFRGMHNWFHRPQRIVKIEAQYQRVVHFIREIRLC